MANDDGLFRMRRLLEVLGNPERDFRAFHIAGTNGKGSTAIMIASILEKAGYTVGLFTSPHLEEYYERIQIWNGEHNCIPADIYAELEQKVDEAANRIASEQSSETGEEFGALHLFEKLTAISYLYFAELNPDYVVLECGLGGRLDSTNTLSKPLVSAITSVSLDHTAILGNTIIKVAREKAGIIKPGVPVVSQSDETLVRNVIGRTAAEMGCEFTDASAFVKECRKYTLGMKGSHQYENAATAVCAVKASGVDVPESAIVEGLEEARHPGRFEIIGENPYWILDGAHNPGAVEALVTTYTAWARTNKIKRTRVIFGCMKDKNYVRMIQSLVTGLKGCSYSTVDIDDDRAEDSVVLGQLIADRGRPCETFESVEDAYKDALSGNYEAILVIGSLYLVGSIRNYCLEERKK